jgi:hypothetical protein
MATKKKYDLDSLVRTKYDLAVDLYRQKARAIAANATGVEYYLYKVFGADKIGSIACAIDPYWQFVTPYVAPGKSVSKVFDTLFPVTVVPIQRSRKWQSILAVPPTHHKGGWDTTTRSNSLHFTGSGWTLNPMDENTVKHTFDEVPLVRGYAVAYLNDTTHKLRCAYLRRKPKAKWDKSCDEGEFELFVPTLYAAGPTYAHRTFESHTRTLSPFGTNLVLVNDAWEVRHGEFTDQVAGVDTAQLASYWSQQKSDAQGTMVKHLDAMLARCMPTRRYFNLAYQIGEIRDLPQTLSSAVHLWRDIEHLIGKVDFTKAYTNPKWWTWSRAHLLQPYMARAGVVVGADKVLSDYYLGFKFGWQSIYQSVTQLVRVPPKITRDVNSLISKNGTFTNLSNDIYFVETVAAPPTVSLPSFLNGWNVDPNQPQGQSVSRSVHLRCMCNVGVNFPPLDVPSLRSKLYFDKLGLYPTPGDLYDLIPWTWMVDWFAGLGDYIHLMDAINGADSPINFGFMSYSSSTNVFAERGFYSTSTIGWQNHPPDPVGGGTSETIRHTLSLSGHLQVKYKLRLSVGTLASVKTYSGSGVTQYQSGILGALVSKFT